MAGEEGKRQGEAEFFLEHDDVDDSENGDLEVSKTGGSSSDEEGEEDVAQGGVPGRSGSLVASVPRVWPQSYR